MKRTLLTAALVGMIAAPAFAELGPGFKWLDPSLVEMTELSGSPSDAAPRTGLAGYKPNDPATLYDTMWDLDPQLRGPGNYSPGASPYLGGGTMVFDKISTRPVPGNPGYVLLSSWAWIFYNPGEVGQCVGGVHTVAFQFFSMYNGGIGYPLHLQFTDPAFGLNSAYGFALNASCGFFISRPFFGYDAEGNQRKLILPKDFWIGIRHITPGVTQVLGTDYATANPPGVGHTHGMGNNVNTANFRGSSDMVLGFSTGGTPSYSPNAGSIFLTLWGEKVPEPATIGFLALGGLLILRRRRA